MKVYEIVFKIIGENKHTKPEQLMHYWSAKNLVFAAQAASDYKEGLKIKKKDTIEVMSVKYILTVTKSVDEVSDE